jgi:hypothetical protein
MDMGIVLLCADPGRRARQEAPRFSSSPRVARVPPVAVALAAVLTILPFTAAAQGFSGRVVDIDRGTGVAGAQVSLLTADDEVIRGVVADSAGRFTIPVARLDTFKLRVEHVAYRTTTSPPYIFEAPAVVEVEVRVSQQEIELEPLVVTAVRGTGHSRLADFYRRVRQYEVTGRGIQLTREDLEPHSGRTVLDVFSLQPVRFQRMNPLRPCRIRTYWNDMLVEDVTDEEWRGYDLPGGQALDDLPASSVEGVEIYDHLGEIPPRYADYGVCGVILIWSRVGPDAGSSTRLWLARGLIGVGAFLVLTLLAP